MTQCLCRSGFYLHARSSDGSSLCLPCPVGSECNESGVTLRLLPIIRGYWRPSQLSVDVRLCDDAAQNCTSGVDGRRTCETSTSGCIGNVGRPGGSICSPGLGGAFCQVCVNNTVRAYYVKAATGVAAGCSACQTSTVAIPIILAILALLMLVLLWYVWFRLVHERYARLQLAIERVAKAMGNKFKVRRCGMRSHTAQGPATFAK